MIRKPIEKKIQTNFFLEDFTIDFNGNDLILRKDDIVVTNATYKKFLDRNSMEKI